MSYLKDKMAEWINNQKLLELIYVKNKRKFTIPCRILQYNDDNMSLIVYHVDEKKTYSFYLNEIEDINESENIVDLKKQEINEKKKEEIIKKIKTLAKGLSLEQLNAISLIMEGLNNSKKSNS